MKQNEDGTFSCHVEGCEEHKSWKKRESVNRHILEFHDDAIVLLQPRSKRSGDSNEQQLRGEFREEEEGNRF